MSYGGLFLRQCDGRQGIPWRKVQCTALMAPEACKNFRRPRGGWLQGPESSVKNILLLRSGKKVGGSFQKKRKKK